MFSKALRLSKVRVMSFSVSVVVAGIPAGPINMLYPESFGNQKYSDISNFVENPLDTGLNLNRPLHPLPHPRLTNIGNDTPVGGLAELDHDAGAPRQ